eukprot:354162-Chlamydomonas_euryale.AAC.2
MHKHPHTGTHKHPPHTHTHTSTATVLGTTSTPSPSAKRSPYCSALPTCGSVLCRLRCGSSTGCITYGVRQPSRGQLQAGCAVTHVRRHDKCGKCDKCVAPQRACLER